MMFSYRGIACFVIVVVACIFAFRKDEKEIRRLTSLTGKALQDAVALKMNSTSYMGSQSPPCSKPKCEKTCEETKHDGKDCSIAKSSTERTDITDTDTNLDRCKEQYPGLPAFPNNIGTFKLVECGRRSRTLPGKLSSMSLDCDCNVKTFEKYEGQWFEFIYAGRVEFLEEQKLVLQPASMNISPTEQQALTFTERLKNLEDYKQEEQKQAQQPGLAPEASNARALDFQRVMVLEEYFKQEFCEMEFCTYQVYVDQYNEASGKFDNLGGKNEKLGAVYLETMAACKNKITNTRVSRAVARCGATNLRPDGMSPDIIVKTLNESLAELCAKREARQSKV